MRGTIYLVRKTLFADFLAGVETEEDGTSNE